VNEKGGEKKTVQKNEKKCPSTEKIVVLIHEGAEV